MILGQVLPIPHIVFVIAFLKAKQKKKTKKTTKKQKPGRPCTGHLLGTEVYCRMPGVLWEGCGGLAGCSDMECTCQD